MDNKVRAIVKPETKYYDTADAKRRAGVFDKKVDGWIFNNELDTPRVLFHYPFDLPEGGKTKTTYVNTEDIKIEKIIKEGPPEVTSQEVEDLTEEEVEILHENTVKHSTPIGGSYFDEPEEGGDCINDPSVYIYPTVQLKPKVVFDINNNRLGNLPNDYYLISSDKDIVCIRNKASSRTFYVLKSNLIGY